MKNLLKIVSFIGLCFTAVPAFLVFYGMLEKNTHFNLMIIGVVLWFCTAPFWMKSPSSQDPDDN